jgi:hypothetical protein
MKLGIYFVGFLIATVLVGSTSAIGAADMTKHNAWKRKMLQQVVDQVYEEGKSTLNFRFPFVKKFDTNKDGEFNILEAEMIESFLETSSW